MRKRYGRRGHRVQWMWPPKDEQAIRELEQAQAGNVDFEEGVDQLIREGPDFALTMVRKQWATILRLMRELERFLPRDQVVDLVLQGDEEEDDPQ